MRYIEHKPSATCWVCELTLNEYAEWQRIWRETQREVEDTVKRVDSFFS